MFNAGVFTEFSAYWIHGYHIFGIVVFYCGEIAEFSLYCVFRCKKINYLDIYSFGTFCGDKVYLSYTEYAH